MKLTMEQLERVRRMIGRSPPWIASDADVVDLRAVLDAAEKATPPEDVTRALAFLAESQRRFITLVRSGKDFDKYDLAKVERDTFGLCLALAVADWLGVELAS